MKQMTLSDFKLQLLLDGWKIIPSSNKYLWKKDDKQIYINQANFIGLIKAYAFGDSDAACLDTSENIKRKNTTYTKFYKRILDSEETDGTNTTKS